jgi:cytochrome c553
LAERGKGHSLFTGNSFVMMAFCQKQDALETSRMIKTLQAAFAMVALLLPLTGAAQRTPTTQPITAEERAVLMPSRSVLESGWSVANTACANCHGLDGISTAPGVPHIAGQRMVYLYRILQAYQDRDRRNDAMNHAIGFLNEDALLSVAAYYANQAPVAVQPRDDSAAEAAGEDGGDPFASIRESMKKCVKCHGEDGNASGSGMPNLTAQDPAYFVQSMQAYRSGERGHRLMQNLVAELDDETLLEMGTFYAVQEPRRTETTGDGNAKLGQALAGECANCHGADGNPTGANMPTLAGQDGRYFGKAMQAYKEGKRSHQQMFEAVESLGEGDIANLAEFYAVQEPVRRNVRTPLTKAEWIQRCDRCHGIEGNSTDPRFPMLAGQERTYLAAALRAYAGTTRSNSVMHAMSAPLGEDDIETIVEYYATSQPKAVLFMQLPCEGAAE